MRSRSAELPPLGYDFGRSIVEAVELGPDKDLALTLAVLEAHGHRGQHAHTVRVEFGGIENLGEVSSFFDDFPSDRALAGLRYSRSEPSEPGHLVLELDCESGAKRLEIRCSTLQVSGPRSWPSSCR